MAKFHYSMENILRIKEKIEEQKRMALGQAMASYQYELSIAEEISGKLTTYLSIFYDTQDNKVDAMQIRIVSQQVSFYEQALKNQKDVVSRALDLVEMKRTELRQALQEKQIQEKLREKALEQYLEEEKLKEQQLLDEVVGYRYATKEDD